MDCPQLDGTRVSRCTRLELIIPDRTTFSGYSSTAGPHSRRPILERRNCAFCLERSRFPDALTLCARVDCSLLPLMSTRSETITCVSCRSQVKEVDRGVFTSHTRQRGRGRGGCVDTVRLPYPVGRLWPCAIGFCTAQFGRAISEAYQVRVSIPVLHRSSNPRDRLALMSMRDNDCRRCCSLIVGFGLTFLKPASPCTMHLASLTRCTSLPLPLSTCPKYKPSAHPKIWYVCSLRTLP